MSLRNEYIRSQSKTDHKNKGNGIVSHCLSTISSVIKGGYNANVMSTMSSEHRDVKILSPFGFTSFPHKGMHVQLMHNDDGSNVILGVYDTSKPHTKLGDVMMYNKSGSTIKIDIDGNIELHHKSGNIIKMSDSGIDVTGEFRVNGRTIV